MPRRLLVISDDDCLPLRLAQNVVELRLRERVGLAKFSCLAAEATDAEAHDLFESRLKNGTYANLPMSRSSYVSGSQPISIAN